MGTPLPAKEETAMRGIPWGPDPHAEAPADQVRLNGGMRRCGMPRSCAVSASKGRQMFAFGAFGVRGRSLPAEPIAAGRPGNGSFDRLPHAPGRDVAAQEPGIECGGILPPEGGNTNGYYKLE